ncbi:hypothetical protein CANTEDRAFT_116446 [Yamadazyma tenuis ATCC 10573]|uniref:Origin recognition complex subunit 3 winged helix C-terminal domain-containing protein n=2 Tax=Candida tenuis TaxID=2315449 RepID=G3BDV9_CANTC|nr:uncharacterized protein CANTEDRAFT_116446 [Yamadazyma tenuis ATCC 10573]EGV60394.1 hypothetical protein CANTEDRAFT_116446 [Yamadazyma tenuis ATCC 10573]
MLRHLPSFKKYIELLLQKHKQGLCEKSEIKMLLTDDHYLMKTFNNVKDQFVSFQSSIGATIEEIQHLSPNTDKFELYNLILSDRFHNSKLSKANKYKISNNFTTNTVFNEVFIISFHQCGQLPKLEENYDNLVLQLLRPNMRRILEQNMTDSAPYLDNELTRCSGSGNSELVMPKLFNLLVEAPSTVNHYEFFMAFKQSLNKDKVIKELKESIGKEASSRLTQILDNCAEDDKEWEKLIYSWFLSTCNELIMVGLFREKPRGDHFEKNIWKGL